MQMKYSLAQIAESEKISVATVTSVLDHLKVPRRGRGKYTALGREFSQKAAAAQAKFIVTRLADSPRPLDESVLSLLEEGVISPGPACQMVL